MDIALTFSGVAFLVWWLCRKQKPYTLSQLRKRMVELDIGTKFPRS